jgi:integrase
VEALLTAQGCEAVHEKQLRFCPTAAHLACFWRDLRIEEIVPLHVEGFTQTKLESGLSAKTVRNLLLVLQAILSFAVDNDLIARSPIRKRHKPTVDRHEKPIWSPAQLLNILSAAPTDLRAFFDCVALTGTRLGEALALKWKHASGRFMGHKISCLIASFLG